MSPARDAWTRLEGHAHVRQSVAFQMNSVVLLDPDHTVIVDPGVLPSEIDDIAREVGSASPGEITLCFTHAHWDHVLGRSWWPSPGRLGRLVGQGRFRSRRN